MSGAEPPPAIEQEGPPRLRGRFGPLRLAYAPLAELPTPAQPLEALGRALGVELWVKRDDLASSAYGGNKVRKLELLLADAAARGRERVVTFGAWGSHHALATAIHGRRLGLAVRLELFPQPVTPHVARQLLCDQAAGAELAPIRFPALVPLRIAARTVLGAPGEVVPPGGSSPLGAVGFVEAGLELADQVKTGLLPAPDLIFVAGGTCGTAAGLALGLELAGLSATVVVVRVIPAVVCNRRAVLRLASRCRARLEEAGLPPGAGGGSVGVELDAHALGPGYGVETPEGRDALERFGAAGLALEPTYTAKAAGALIRWAGGPARGKRVLFWHTLSSADLGPLLAKADAAALPPVLREVVRKAGR